ncbi:thioredoxin-disulfide reductase [Candidatus Uhrbacteria bacterium RIFCSPHIGHO2_01_FULL_63_20]|uniref:Thioredoxin reductase n=1 Tax=Candidatus Uhrbacteria bacterium RIFCSPHIGHO2_01_FULL_63_20 TaxID=1802385 RepID=A0A1F7TNN2_9BACT|nr:MAG: thioredoxin-disulfide reductase [Candidatus Uhrbacteria bacterium RIFCSPHIGHO2_01_FULL_63_20]
MDIEKLIIIGSGPSGYTAAIYAARATLSPLLFEGVAAGGQLMLTTEVENYPGFPEGIQGPELMPLFKKQAQRFGTRIVSDDVVSVDFSARPFTVKSGDREVKAESVIISTGASAKWLGVPGEKEYGGRGVSACATCDGFFFRDKKVLVAGGGDAAMEEALFLTRFATSVTVLVRTEALRASKIMAERAMKNPKITFVWNASVTEVVGDGTKMTGVKTVDTKTGATGEMAADGLFVAIGHKPNTEIFKGQVELDEKGYVVLHDGTQRTSVTGVFASGDVADHVYRQAITAAGTGCAAALEAERWLASRE